MAEQKALFFDTISSTYNKIRPGYVKELYQDLYAYKHIDSCSKVLEVGIGTGQATEPVLMTGCSYTAVELGRHLAAIAAQKFADYPNFSLEITDFLEFDGRQNTYDLIYSATAFHWIPEDAGYRKVFGLLKSGGVFARFANNAGMDREKPKLHDALQRLYGKYMGKTDKKALPIEMRAEERVKTAEKYGFVNGEYYLYERTRTFSSEEYLAVLHTYPDHMQIEETIRKDFFSRIKHEIDHFGGSITIYDTIDLELAMKP